MGRKKVEPAYQQILELGDIIRGISSERQLYRMRYVGDSVRRVPTEVKSLMIDMSFGQMNFKLKELLSKKALSFAIGNIMMELKKYNMLWHHEGSDGNTREILAELREKKVIFSTEATGIYLVNPILMWRGDVHSVVEATKKALRGNGKVPSLEIIKDLQPPRNSDLIPPDLLDQFDPGRKYDLDNIEPLRLEEPEVVYNKTVM